MNTMIANFNEKNHKAVFDNKAQAIFIKKSDTSETKAKERSIFIKSVIAIFGITCGILLMLTGLILSGISFFSKGEFRGWDVITLVISFILLAFGSHFLDKADAADKAARIEYCEEHGLTGKECGERYAAKKTVDEIKKF